MMYQTISQTLNLDCELKSAYDSIKLTREGLSKDAINSLSETLEISGSEIIELLPISRRTLERYDKSKKLSSDLSDRLIQIAKVHSRAVEVFEDRNKAVKWLKSPCIALGRLTPISCLDTFSGMEIVLDELGRIEYGVYS